MLFTPLGIYAQKSADHYADRFRLCIEGGMNPEKKTVSKDSLLIAKSIIAEAVKLYPNRIDLHHAKISTAIALEDAKATQAAVLDFIEQARSNGYKWHVYNDYLTTVAEGKEATVSSFNTFANLYRNFPYGEGEVYLKAISEGYLSLDPECVDALNYAAISYMDNNPHKALQFLLKAQTLQPDDCGTISNLVTTYFLERNKEQANYWATILECLPEVPDAYKTLARYLQAQPDVCINQPECKVVSVKDNGDGTKRAVIVVSVKNPSAVPAFLQADIDLYDGDTRIASASPTQLAIPDGEQMQQSKLISFSPDLKSFRVAISLKSADGVPIEHLIFDYNQ